MLCARRFCMSLFGYRHIAPVYTIVVRGNAPTQAKRRLEWATGHKRENSLGFSPLGKCYPTRNKARARKGGSQMKLSEAILLGSTMLTAKAGGQHFSENQAGCALDMAAV